MNFKVTKILHMLGEKESEVWRYRFPTHWHNRTTQASNPPIHPLSARNYSKTKVSVLSKHRLESTASAVEPPLQTMQRYRNYSSACETRTYKLNYIYIYKQTAELLI